MTLELRQGKYSKYLPYVFTEQGIYMLMTVLKGDLAVRQSKALIRTFKEMKDFINENRSLVGGRELLQLSLQTTKNTEDIAVIKQSPNTNITFTKTCGIFHDRYIVIDYKTPTEKIYHCGASSKDAGSKVTSITLIAEMNVYHQIIDNPALVLN